MTCIAFPFTTRRSDPPELAGAVWPDGKHHASLIYGSSNSLSELRRAVLAMSSVSGLGSTHVTVVFALR